MNSTPANVEPSIVPEAVGFTEAMTPNSEQAAVSNAAVPVPNANIEWEDEDVQAYLAHVESNFLNFTDATDNDILSEAEGVSEDRDTVMNPLATSLVSTCSVDSSISSGTAEVGSLDEVNTILNELSLGNRKLKETLTENSDNVRMKLDEAYRNLQSTMLKMSSIDQVHKAKCDERVAEVEQLRAENQKLNVEVESRKLEYETMERVKNSIQDKYESSQTTVFKLKIKIMNNNSANKNEVACLTRELSELKRDLEISQLENEKLQGSIRRTEEVLTAERANNNILRTKLSQVQEKRNTEFQNLEDYNGGNAAYCEDYNGGDAAYYENYNDGNTAFQNFLDYNAEMCHFEKIRLVRSRGMNDLVETVKASKNDLKSIQLETSSQTKYDSVILNERINAIVEKLAICESQLTIRNGRKELDRGNDDEFLVGTDDQILVPQTQDNFIVPEDSAAVAPKPHDARNARQEFDEDVKKCPICQKKFYTLAALVSHTSHCGKLRNPA